MSSNHLNIVMSCVNLPSSVVIDFYYIMKFRSPIEADEKEVVKLAKKLKKEKVNIDIVSFGEDEDNTDILNKFITTINGKEGTGSHLVTIPPGPHLSDALVSSPIVQVV